MKHIDSFVSEGGPRNLSFEGLLKKYKNLGGALFNNNIEISKTIGGFMQFVGRTPSPPGSPVSRIIGLSTNQASR